jgi:hypothetical protein
MGFDVDTSELRKGGSELSATGRQIVDRGGDIPSDHILQLQTYARETFRSRQASGNWRKNINTGFNREIDTSHRVEKSRSLKFKTPYSYAELGTGPRGIGGDSILLKEFVGDGSDGFDAPSSSPPFDKIRQWAFNKGITPEEYNSFTAMVEAIRYSIKDDGTDAIGSVIGLWAEQQNLMERDFKQVIEDEVANFHTRQKRISKF